MPIIHKGSDGLHKVYIELVFLDNFIVNLLIILLASRLTKTNVRWRRFVAAAALGGVYACIAFGISNTVVWLPVKVAAGFAMCAIAFFKRGGRVFWRNVCAFWGASFLLAGAIYAAMLGFGEPATIGGAVIVRPPVRYILVGLFVGAVVTSLLARVRRSIRERESHAQELTLVLEGKSVTVKAFVDTGNWVREPLSGLAVIFLNHSAAIPLLGNDYMALVMRRSAELTPRLRIVPCETAAGSVLLYGIEIDAVSLKGSTHRCRAVVCVPERPVAGGFDAVAGVLLIDELKKGAIYEDAVGTKADRGDTAEIGAGRERRLHQRERGTAAAADTAGGGEAADATGTGGQVGQARAH